MRQDYTLVHDLVTVPRLNERENWCLHNCLKPDSPESLHMCAQFNNLIAKLLISMFAFAQFEPQCQVTSLPYKIL